MFESKSMVEGCEELQLIDIQSLAICWVNASQKQKQDVIDLLKENLD